MSNNKTLAQGSLCHRPENKGEDERCQWIIKLLEDKSDKGKNHNQPDVEEVVIHGVTAYQTENSDNRRKNRKRNPQNRNKERNRKEVQQNSHDITGVEAGDETPYEFLLLYEKQRSRLKSPDQKASEKDCCGRRTRA